MTAIDIIRHLLESDIDQPTQADVNRLAGTYRVKYLVFQSGQGPYGSGGWSRNARHRPQPTVVTKDTDSVFFQGKSVIVDGVRRLKCNVWDALKKPVRIDYPELEYAD